MMRNILLKLLLMAATFACHPKEQLISATILVADPTMCACCGGWFVVIDSVQYRVYRVPEVFAKPQTPVWVRYRPDESNCGQSMGRTIVLTDIRAR